MPSLHGVIVEDPPREHHPHEQANSRSSGVATVSIDLAKHVFQVHAVDASGKALVAKELRYQFTKYTNFDMVVQWLAYPVSSFRVCPIM